MDKVFHISLKPNLSQNTLGCYEIINPAAIFVPDYRILVYFLIHRTNTSSLADTFDRMS